METKKVLIYFYVGAFFFSSRNETNFAARIFETIPVELFRHYAEKLQFSMHIIFFITSVKGKNIKHALKFCFS